MSLNRSRSSQPKPLLRFDGNIERIVPQGAGAIELHPDRK